MKSTPNLAQTGTPSDLAGSTTLDDYRLVDLKWVFRSILRRKIVFSTEDFAVGVCYITKMGVLFDPSKKFVCSAADFAVWGLLHHHHESEKII